MARYEKDHAGYPVLVVELSDGREARITSQTLKSVLVERGFVFLGPEFTDMPAPVLPADRADGRDEQRLPGFTTDPEIIAEVDKFLAAINDGSIWTKLPE